MKKRTISLILVVCFLICLFPSAALAVDSPADEASEPQFSAYSAIGDSICAGFTQADYQYENGMGMNIEDSPELCYAQLTGKALGSEVFNLGKLACDTEELLDILTNPNHVVDKINYYNLYRGYIENSDLITLEIGANDLSMAALSSLLEALGPEYADIEPSSVFYLLVPFLQGDFDGMVASIETMLNIELTPEQIKALMLVNSDDVLGPTLEEGYQEYVQNFPLVVENINKIIQESNSDAKLVILNYYNPYYGFNEALGDKGVKFTWKYEDCEYNYNIAEVFQVPTDKMNIFSQEYCEENNLTYVDISDVNILHGLTNGADPHPNNAGHAYIAAEIVEALTNTVTATAQTGGMITPSGINVVKDGESVTFAIAPKSGYKISDVLVDGVSVGAVSTYTFENVTADHTIIASFKTDVGTPPSDGSVYYETYAALGDSITAGYSFGSIYPEDSCYAAVAADNLGVKNYYNLGIPAYKTKDLLNTLTKESDPLHAQFVNDLAASDLVTINIGSNDLTMALLDMFFEYQGIDLDNMSPKERLDVITSFLDTMKNGAESDTIEEELINLQAQITEEQIGQILANINARYAQAYIDFKANWDDIITAIRDIKPKVAIVALGYYSPIQKFEYNSTTFEIGEAGRKGIDTINYIAGVSQGYIDQMNKYISEESPEKDKYLYVETAGVELITVGGITIDPHPSEAGHALIAARIVDRVLNNIIAVPGELATVSPGEMKTVAYGHTEEYCYPYTFTPATASSIKDVYVDGQLVEAPGGSYTFKEVSADHTISVTSAVTLTVPDEEIKAYYTVTPTYSKGGSITVNPPGSVIQGTDVTIFINPDPGYEIDYITRDGQPINTANIVTIKNIGANHSVYAAFKLSSESSDHENPFEDIKDSDWFYEAAMYGYANGIIKGTSGTTFDPDATVNLAMIRTLLYQMEKEPSVSFDSSLSLVANGKWYTNAFIWSIKSGITIKAGLGATQPEDEITREEIVTFLYLYAKYKGYEVNASANLNVYVDSSSVSDWASAAMQWAVAEGLVKGTGNAHLEPDGTATRAEVAELIYRFIVKFGK